MKKIYMSLSILGIICMVFLATNTKQTVAQKGQDLVALATILQGENININEWVLHAREKLENADQEDVQEYAEYLKGLFPDWNWQLISTSEKWEVTGTLEASGEQQERIQILSNLTHHDPQTYIIYEAQDKEFTQQTRKFLEEELNTKLSAIFRGNATIFSCISGDINDKMYTSLPIAMKNLLEVFQAKEIDTLDETNFVSVSAVSPFFAESLTMNNNEMNMQIGMRINEWDARTHIVVGTPIITIEY